MLDILAPLVLMMAYIIKKEQNVKTLSQITVKTTKQRIPKLCTVLDAQEGG